MLRCDKPSSSSLPADLARLAGGAPPDTSFEEGADRVLFCKNSTSVACLYVRTGECWANFSRKKALPVRILPGHDVPPLAQLGPVVAAM